jgi:hypothetical protein
MNRRHFICIAGVLGLFCLAALAPVSGLNDRPVELKDEASNIRGIIDNESAYHDKWVVIEGKIATQCPGGCWFVVDDETAKIFVTIGPNNFTIPQKVGSGIRVLGNVTDAKAEEIHGNFVLKEGMAYMIGKILEIDGTIYRGKS